MVSQIKVNEIIKQSGSSITIGESGDTINIGTTGDTINLAGATASVAGSSLVIAEKSGDQTGIADNAFTKITYETDTYDPDSLWDTSNSRYTAPVAGRYYFTARAFLFPATANGTIVSHRFAKNGSQLTSTHMSIGLQSDKQYVSECNLVNTTILNLAANDYIEYMVQYNVASGTITCDDVGSQFLAFRLD